MDLHGNIIRIRYFHKVMKHVVFQNAVGPFGVGVKSLWRAACILHQTLEIPLCISCPVSMSPDLISKRSPDT